MRIVDPSEELANPNVCTICEETPKPANERVVDTQRSKYDDWSNTQGQKYVCERCGTEIANLLGFVSGASITATVQAAADAHVQLANVQARVAELATGIADFVNTPGAGSTTVAPAVFTENSAAATAAQDGADAVAKSYEDVFGAADPVVEKPTKAASTDSTIGSKPEA